MEIWDNEAKSEEELLSKMHVRLIEFRKKMNDFEYLLAQMEVMIEDYIDLKDGQGQLAREFDEGQEEKRLTIKVKTVVE